MPKSMSFQEGTTEDKVFWLAVIVYHAFDWIPAYMDTLVNSNKTVCIVCYLCRDGLVLVIALTQGCALDRCSDNLTFPRSIISVISRVV